MPRRRYETRLLLDACCVALPGLIALGLAAVLQSLTSAEVALLAAGALLSSLALAVRARNSAVIRCIRRPM